MKRGMTFIFLLGIIILFSSIFVSASLWDKITGNVVSDSCIDSDGGQNYYVKGNATGYLFSDSNEIGTREDQCAKKRFENGEFVGWNYVQSCEENCGVSESFCHELNSGKTTASSLEFECPGACEKGACLQETTVSCTDSDKSLSDDIGAGLNYYKKGTVTIWANNQVSETKTDYCNGNQLVEFVCDSNKIESGDYNCPNGCEKGKCLEPSQSCTDTDNGINIYKKGYRTNWNNAYADYKIRQGDYCIKNPTITTKGNVIADEAKKVSSCEGEGCYIIEYACQEDLSNASIGFSCPKGCNDGVCIQGEDNLFFENYNYFLENGNFNDKLDIFFIPFNVTQDFFNEFIQKAIYSDGRYVSNECGDVEARGLLNVEPLKSNQNKFNIEFSNKSLDFNYFDCSYFEGQGLYSKPYISCDWDKLRQNIPFNPDIIVLVGKDYRTSADKDIILFGDLASADPTTPINSGFVHEFGHAFGGLTDEYTYSFTYNCDGEDCSYIGYLPDPCINSEDPNCFSKTENEIAVIPNEDTLGCPKWCESYDSEKLKEISSECTSLTSMKDCIQSGCLWFAQKNPWFDSKCIPRKTWEDIGINCTDQCILGQHYGHVSFSPDCSEGGMMSNSIGDFNSVSKEHLGMALNCCFPKSSSQECKDFSESFELTSDVNPYFKFVYDKFASCYIGSEENNYEKTIEEKSALTLNNQENDCIIGCFVDNKCYPFNYRKNGEYCSINEGEFISQLEPKSICENDFECSSNLCIDGKCISSGLWQKFLGWLQKLFG